MKKKYRATKIVSSPEIRLKKSGSFCSCNCSNSPDINSKIEHSTIDNLAQSPYKDRQLSNEEITNVLSALDNCFLFNDMPKQIIEIIMLELQQFSLEKGDILYNQGDIGSFFYIVAKGKLVSLIDNKEKKRYTQWDCFGGLSLINQDIKRDETVKALTQVDLLCLSKDLYMKIKKKIADEKYKDRFNFINTISFLKNLDVITKYNVSDKLITASYKKGDVIIKEGAISDAMYCIKEGSVSCQLNKKEIRKLYAQSCFGDCGLLLNAKRTLDIIAIEPTICYVISKDTLIEVLGSNFIDVILYSMFRVNIVNNVFFKDILLDSLMLNLFQCFSLKKYSNLDTVYRKNVIDNKTTGGRSEYNDKIMLIIEGSLYFEGKDLPFANKGNVIGEDILFKDIVQFNNNVVAHPDCVCLEAKSEDIRKVLGIEKNKKEGNQFNIYKRISKLKRLYLFKTLSDGILEEIAILMKKRKYNENEYIVKEGDEGNSLFLISKGRVAIKKNENFLRYLETGNCFGEITLLSSKKEKRTASVVATEHSVICYEISKKDFDKILVNNVEIKNYLLKKIALTDVSIQLKDLFFYKILGKGKFGNVYLVHNKKNIYAIKCVSRSKVNKEKVLGKYLLNERRIMLAIDHPFIVKLIKMLKNNKFFFFLIEYVNGINLDEYLNTKEKFKNFEETQFYLSILVTILEYLQKKNIVHRDIKPANIMIDSSGYLKMIDFGTAKVLTDYTSTVVGTPHYISPEILLGKGYSSSCDYWSLGICAHEIFYGFYPFGNYANEVMEIYKDIVNNDYTLPITKDKYKPINQFISVLLEKDVSKRVCNAKELKKLSIFTNFEWDRLNNFKIVPPYVPKIFDVSNVLNMLGTPFEAELDKESKGVEEESSCDVSSRSHSDKSWANEF